jgi:hypothetical protein
MSGRPAGDERPTGGRRRGGLTRRHFLIVSAAFLTPLVLRPRPLASLTGPSGQDIPATTGRLTDLFRDPDSARVIGQAFLRLTPEEGSSGALVTAIGAGLPGGIAALDDPIEPDDLRALLAARIQRDFADDAVVELEGWIVSRTEARLCGIVALA